MGPLDRVILGANMECPIVTNGELRHSCANVCEPSELQFGVVRGVGQGIGDDAACSQITLGNHVIWLAASCIFKYRK